MELQIRGVSKTYPNGRELMNRWLRRIRGALGMGLTWAIVGALLGVLIEMVDNAFFGGAATASMIDVWPPVLAVLGFMGGSVFSVVLSIAAGRRRFDELSLLQFAVWGAVGGMLLGMFAVAAGVGSGDPAPFWLRAAALIGVPMLGSAVAAAGTLALARMAEERESLDAGPDVAEMGLTEGEAQGQLGGGD